MKQRTIRILIGYSDDNKKSIKYYGSILDFWVYQTKKQQGEFIDFSLKEIKVKLKKLRIGV